MKTNKVKLIPVKHVDSRNSGLPLITHALPFYKSQLTNAKYFHRVRTMENHWLGHTSITQWCGAQAFFGEGRGKLYAEIPEGGVMCATCEGRAIGAGEDGSRIINGRQVMYSPRRNKDEQ
jgi:hypothetical protein